MTNLKYPLHSVTLLLALCLSSFTAANAQGRADPLTGVKKVTVLVSMNATGEAPVGINEDRLRTILELRLRSAGLRVLTDDEDRSDPELNPYVFLKVGTLETKNKAGQSIGYVYRFDLSARVFAIVPVLNADPSRVRAVSSRPRAPMELWSDYTMAVGSNDDAPKQIEDIVNQLIDSFMNAWLKANPR